MSYYVWKAKKYAPLLFFEKVGDNKQDDEANI